MKSSRQKLINLGCTLTIMVLFCFQQAYCLEDKWISVKNSDEPQSFTMGSDDSMYDFYTGPNGNIASFSPNRNSLF